MEGKAVNVIKFSAKGLNLLSGQLTIDASFKIASKSVSALCYILSTVLLTFMTKETRGMMNFTLLMV